ncbi:MAG: cell division protein ZapA [Anaerovoracaceae bacterium]|jgi:cell division protein ZapA
MAQNNRTTVKIFGQQYTIAGTASSEEMEQVAAHVDKTMNELAKGLPSLSTLSLAVLAAVNVASEYYDSVEENEKSQAEIEKLKKDQDHYVQLWEDAKASFKKYREDAQNSVEQLQELQRIYNMKNVELSDAKTALEEMTGKLNDSEEKLKAAEEKASSLEEQIGGAEEAESKLSDAEEENKKLEAKISELEKKLKDAEKSEENESKSLEDFQNKYKELENSFFDIQMENINLKNELDEYKNPK